MPMKRLPTVALTLVLTALPMAARTQMSPMGMAPETPAQDGMEGMGAAPATPAPAKKAAPGGMKGMPTPPKPAQNMEAMPARPAAAAPMNGAPPPTQGMGEMPTPKPSEAMGAVPSAQGMAMAEEMEEADHGSSVNGGRILWTFLVLNAGILAVAALLKSKRAFAKSAIEVKP